MKSEINPTIGTIYISLMAARKKHPEYGRFYNNLRKMYEATSDNDWKDIPYSKDDFERRIPLFKEWAKHNYSSGKETAIQYIARSKTAIRLYYELKKSKEIHESMDNTSRLYTVKDLIAYLNSLKYNSDVNIGRLEDITTTIKSVYSSLFPDIWETVQLTKLNIKGAVEKYAQCKYKLSSRALREYKSRIRRGLIWFSIYIEYPDWQPKNGQYIHFVNYDPIQRISELEKNNDYTTKDKEFEE